MHQCLKIQEILAAILACTEEEGNRSGRLSTVYACALTCRSFLDPALNEIWKVQQGLQNLIKLLPQDTWIERDELNLLNAHNELAFSRTLVRAPQLIDNITYPYAYIVTILGCFS